MSCSGFTHKINLSSVIHQPFFFLFFSNLLSNSDLLNILSQSFVVTCKLRFLLLQSWYCVSICLYFSFDIFELLILFANNFEICYILSGLLFETLMISDDLLHLFVLLKYLSQLDIVSVFQHSNFLVQSSKLICNIRLIFIDLIEFFSISFRSQHSWSFLPVIFIPSYDFSQFLLDPSIMNDFFIQSLILNGEGINCFSHIVRLFLPKFILILLGGATSIIVVLAALDTPHRTGIVHLSIKYI